MDILTTNGYLDFQVFKEEVKHAVQKCKRGASP